MLLMEMLNKRGPRNDPCVTPRGILFPILFLLYKGIYKFIGLVQEPV